MRRAVVVVRDKMQADYRYELSEPEGQNFDPEFRPELTPPELLRLGVFGGKYMTDCTDEFPRHGFSGRSFLLMAAIPPSTSSELTQASPFPHGAQRAGFTEMILAAGFSGTAATIAGAAWTTIRVRSSDGGRCGGTSAKSSAIARRETSFVVDANGKRCCIGPMTAA